MPRPQEHTLPPLLLRMHLLRERVGKEGGAQIQLRLLRQPLPPRGRVVTTVLQLQLRMVVLLKLLRPADPGIRTMTRATSSTTQLLFHALSCKHILYEAESGQGKTWRSGICN